VLLRMINCMPRGQRGRRKLPPPPPHAQRATRRGSVNATLSTRCARVLLGMAAAHRHHLAIGQQADVRQACSRCRRREAAHEAKVEPRVLDELRAERVVAARALQRSGGRVMLVVPLIATWVSCAVHHRGRTQAGRPTITWPRQPGQRPVRLQRGTRLSARSISCLHCLLRGAGVATEPDLAPGDSGMRWCQCMRARDDKTLVTWPASVVHSKRKRACYIRSY
jgi:hypothetical protein